MKIIHTAGERKFSSQTHLKSICVIYFDEIYKLDNTFKNGNGTIKIANALWELSQLCYTMHSGIL